MMQELTTLHSSLAASAALSQVAQSQVLSKTGPMAGGSVVRRKSSIAAKGVIASKRRPSAPNALADGRRHSYGYTGIGPPPGAPLDSNGHSPMTPYVYDGALSPTSAAYPPPGSGHGFSYGSRPSSSAGLGYAHGTFTSPWPSQTQDGYYSGAHQDHSYPPPVSQHGHYAPYGPAPDEVYGHEHEGAPPSWRPSSSGGEMHGEPTSRYESTLSAHLHMRAPTLRSGRAGSPPSTAQSLRPSSSSSLAMTDRPTLPPLSSLSRPGTAHGAAGMSAHPLPGSSRRPSLMETGSLSALPSLSAAGDESRPYTSPSAGGGPTPRPSLPSVRTTSAVRPGSRGSVLDPPSFFESSMGRSHPPTNREEPGFRRPSSSSGALRRAEDGVRTSPPSSNSPFHFQPPPLGGSAAHSYQRPSSLSRPSSRDRLSTPSAWPPALPPLSNTLSGLKRSRDQGLDGRPAEDDASPKRMRPFTSGDMPAPPHFGSSSHSERRTSAAQADIEDELPARMSERRVSIASLVGDEGRPGSSPEPSPR